MTIVPHAYLWRMKRNWMAGAHECFGASSVDIIVICLLCVVVGMLCQRGTCCGAGGAMRCRQWPSDAEPCRRLTWLGVGPAQRCHGDAVSAVHMLWFWSWCHALPPTGYGFITATRPDAAGAWSSPRWTGNLPLFTLHVFRDLLCFPITFQTTVPSLNRLGAGPRASAAPALDVQN